MSDFTIQKTESALLIVGAAIVLYAGYKTYKAGATVATTISDTLESAKNTVVAAKDNVVSVFQNAYAEGATLVTGTKHYSPDSLAGSMSRADAIKLAEDMAARDSEMDDLMYAKMAREEAGSLLRRHAANAGSDPSITYYGYGS